MSSRRVVITGMGLVSCFGNNIDQFYQKVLLGKSGVRTVPEFEELNLPTTFAAFARHHHPEDYFSAKEYKRYDQAITFTMGSSVDACKMANLDFTSIDLGRIGCIIGSGMGGMGKFMEGTQTLYNPQKGARRVSPFFVPNIITNMGGGLVAIRYGMRGPNYSISTACATANYSIKAAADHILRDEADVMVAGGVEASQNGLCAAGFSAMKALSRDKHKVAMGKSGLETSADTLESKAHTDPSTQSRPWDKNRDGFVLSSGAGVLLLEELEHAKKRGAKILGEYLGGAFNCDAYHMTSPREDGAIAANCIEQALKNARVTPGEVDYVNAHGTSTPVGDLCEVNAIHKVFGKDTDIKMNSIKSMIGHSLGAAGGIEAISILKAFETERLFPTINVDDPEEALRNIDIIQNKSQNYCGNIAISNSFGFGGHNSTLVFKKYED